MNTTKWPLGKNFKNEIKGKGKKFIKKKGRKDEKFSSKTGKIPNIASIYF